MNGHVLPVRAFDILVRTLPIVLRRRARPQDMAYQSSNCVAATRISVSRNERWRPMPPHSAWATGYRGTTAEAERVRRMVSECRRVAWLGGVRRKPRSGGAMGTRGTPRGLGHDSRARRRHRAQDAGLRSRCWRNSPRDWPRRTNGAGRTRAGRRGSSCTKRVWRLKSFRLIRRDQSAKPRVSTDH